MSPYQEAELRLAPFLHLRSFRERELERNPKYRVLREQVYRLAMEIAVEREKAAIVAAEGRGEPYSLIIWEENRPNGARRPKRCCNCSVIIRRAKAGRCRRCAQVWAVSHGTRERAIPRAEREANAIWRTLRNRSLASRAPRRASGWADPTLRFSVPDEAVVAAPEPPREAPRARNGNGSHRSNGIASNGNGHHATNGNGNGHHATFGDPDWRSHLTTLLTTTTELQESA